MLTVSSHQISATSPFVTKWSKIGMSTDPIDRSRAMDAVNLAYECAGLPTPTKFIWCQSPLAADLAHRLVKSASVIMKIRDSVTQDIRLAIKNSVSKTARAEVKDTFSNLLRDVVSDTILVTDVSDHVWAGVSDSLWEAGLGDHWDLGQLTSTGSAKWCFGSHEVGWLSYYSFFWEECGLSPTSKLEGLMAIAKECGWLIPCESVVFVSAKPSKIDQRAISYADGLECKF